MTMRTTFTQKTLLAVLTVLSCAGAFAAPAALADTGGVARRRAGTRPARAGQRVHKTGIATWFGPGFYGKKTACGQIMTPDIVGVANRTLPCGTLVKVSYRGPSLDRCP